MRNGGVRGTSGMRGRARVWAGGHISASPAPLNEPHAGLAGFRELAAGRGGLTSPDFVRLRVRLSPAGSRCAGLQAKYVPPPCELRRQAQRGIGWLTSGCEDGLAALACFPTFSTAPRSVKSKGDGFASLACFPTWNLAPRSAESKGDGFAALAFFLVITP